ncbi:MAG: MFS transporter, partial [Chloroflexi bacterium]|nr:MFS transporter [Chloroflexota bacterium]
LAAMGFRIASVLLLTTLLELHTDVKAEEAVPLKRFLKEVGGTNLGRAMLLLMLMSFMVNLAGPHFTPYMLRDLRLDYFTFSIMEVAAAVGAALTVTHWGFAADRVGNRRMLCVAGVLVSLVPLLWLVSSNIVYLAVVQVYTGFAWAGFNLTSVNFLFDATTDRNRTAYLSLFNAGAGIVGTLGALTGGALVIHLPALFGVPVLMLFALSGGLRLGVAIAFVSVVREVRRVSTLSALEVFHLMVAGKPAHRTASHGRTFRIHDPQPVRRTANGGDNDLSAEWRRISDLV